MSTTNITSTDVISRSNVFGKFVLIVPSSWDICVLIWQNQGIAETSVFSSLPPSTVPSSLLSNISTPSKPINCNACSRFQRLPMFTSSFCSHFLFLFFPLLFKLVYLPILLVSPCVSRVLKYQKSGCSIWQRFFMSTYWGDCKNMKKINDGVLR